MGSLKDADFGWVGASIFRPTSRTGSTTVHAYTHPASAYTGQACGRCIPVLEMSQQAAAIRWRIDRYGTKPDTPKRMRQTLTENWEARAGAVRNPRLYGNAGCWVWSGA
jgi:hypothetical protein